MSSPTPEQPVAEPAPKVTGRGKLALLFGLPVLVAVLIGGTIWLVKGGTEPAESEAFELRGIITLDSSDADPGKLKDSGYRTCSGKRGYDDIRAGAQVTVYDAAGKAVALGTLGDSELKDGECTIQFSVPDVPGGQAIYEVEVAHRGKVRYEEDRAKSGSIALTLG